MTTNYNHCRLAILGTILHLGLAACLFVEYLIYVPTAKKSFDEFGVSLPWVTLCVIRISNWLREDWWLVLPIVVLLATIQLLTLLKLDDSSPRIRFKLAWVLCVGMSLAFVGFATTAAIEMARPWG